LVESISKLIKFLEKEEALTIWRILYSLYFVFFQLGLVALILDKNNEESIKNFTIFMSKASKNDKNVNKVRKIVELLKRGKKLPNVEIRVEKIKNDELKRSR